MSKTVSVQAPDIHRATAAFVMKVLEKIVRKTHLQILAREAGITPPVPYLSFIKLGRWFHYREYPTLGTGQDCFSSGLNVEVRENGESLCLCFVPDHLPKASGTPDPQQGYGYIDLMTLQKHVEEGNAERLNHFANLIRVAVVAAIQADEHGMQESHRPAFTCETIEMEL